MGVRKYTKEVIKEAKRVRWPKREIFLLSLVTTLVICVFVALVLRFEDFVSGKLITELQKVFENIKK